MITKTVSGLKLKVIYNRGKDENGKDIIKRQSFSRLNLEATEDALYSVGEGLASVLNFQLVNIEREEDSVITSSEI